MKFLSAISFEKHLGQSTPAHLTTLYALFSPDVYERKYFVHVISKHLYPKGEISFKEIEFDSGIIETIIEELESPDLFKTQQVLVIDQIHKCKKMDIDRISSYLKKNPQTMPLIFTGNASSSNTQLYESLKKEIVLLDLSAEKSWEKLQRLRAWAVQYAGSLGKTIQPEALDLIFYRIEASLLELRQRLDQCSGFLGDHKIITVDVIEQIVPVSKEQSLWQQSEKLIWGKGPLENKEVHLPDIQVLIGALRYHAELGIQIAECIALETMQHQVQNLFPKVNPKQLSTYWQWTISLPYGYFKKVLEDLFTLELEIRQSVLSSDYHLSIFAEKLAYYRKICHES